MGDIRQKLLPVFFDEAAGHLHTIDQCLAGLEQKKLDNRDLEAAFRAAHSIKGTAGLVKLKSVSTVALRLEDSLEALLEMGELPTPMEVEGLQKTFTRLKDLLQAAVKGLSEEQDSVAETGRKAGPAPASTAAAPLPAEEHEPTTEAERIRIRLSYCNFCIGGQSYHLRVEDMVEITELPPVTFLPLSPEFICGLVTLRGTTMPVIDLGRLHRRELNSASELRLVVVQGTGERLGFLAEGLPNLAAERIGELLEINDFLRHYGVKPADGQYLQ